MCTTACYDKALHDQAETMDGTYLPMQFLPFEEAKSNPMLANFVKYVGRDKADAFAAYGWVATIAFADAVKAVVATDGVNGLTRSALFTGIKTLTKFDADGMYGTVDPRQPQDLGVHAARAVQERTSSCGCGRQRPARSTASRRTP